MRASCITHANTCSSICMADHMRFATHDFHMLILSIVCMCKHVEGRYIRRSFAFSRSSLFTNLLYPLCEQSFKQYYRTTHIVSSHIKATHLLLSSISRELSFTHLEPRTIPQTHPSPIPSLFANIEQRTCTPSRCPFHKLMRYISPRFYTLVEMDGINTTNASSSTPSTATPTVVGLTTGNPAGMAARGKLPKHIGVFQSCNVM